MEQNELILGWVLGILSTPLVMYFTAFVDRRRFEDTLNEELRELRFRFANMIYILRSHIGKLDITNLKWIEKEFKRYPSGEERDRSLKFIERLVALSQDELDAYVIADQKPNKTKAVPHVGVPYLSSRLEALGLLCGKKQRCLVNLLHHINIINVKSDEVREWNKLTFEVTGNNNSAAYENAKAGMAAIISSAERAVEYAASYQSQLSCRLFKKIKL